MLCKSASYKMSVPVLAFLFLSTLACGNTQNLPAEQSPTFTEVPPAQAPVQAPTAIQPTPTPTPIPPTPKPDFSSIMAPVLSGQGVPDAAVYDPDAPGPHSLIILNSSGEPHSWNEQLPPDWIPSLVSETELVVLVEDREVKLGTQAYIGGPSITRYRYEMDVQVFEARNGEIVLSRTLKGSEPNPFPQTAPKEQIRLNGSRVSYTDFQDVLFDDDGQLLLSLRSLCWLTEYTEKLSSGALSPNGQTLASGGYTDSNIVQVWRVTDDTLLHKLEGTTESRIESITFSPDGQMLAVGTRDGLVHLWRISDGELLHTLKGHTDGVSALAFSPDGQILASGGWSDDIVQVWRVSDGELLHTLEGPVYSLTFSPDGQVLASGARDNPVRLWRVSDGELLLTLIGHTNRAASLTFSLDGEMLASASVQGRTVHLSRVSDGELLHTLAWHTDLLTSIAFSPDGQMLASGSLAEIRLWQVADGALLQTLWRHTGLVTNLAFSPDGKNLISGSNDAICIWTIHD